MCRTLHLALLRFTSRACICKAAELFPYSNGYLYFIISKGNLLFGEKNENNPPKIVLQLNDPCNEILHCTLRLHAGFSERVELITGSEHHDCVLCQTAHLSLLFVR